VVIPDDEAFAVLFRARLVFEKPIRIGLHGVAALAAVLAPFEVGGELFVADEAVVPGVGDGDFQAVAAGLEGGEMSSVKGGPARARRGPCH
jgi:hypothetical protein